MSESITIRAVANGYTAYADGAALQVFTTLDDLIAYLRGNLAKPLESRPYPCASARGILTAAHDPEKCNFCQVLRSEKEFPRHVLD